MIGVIKQISSKLFLIILTLLLSMMSLFVPINAYAGSGTEGGGTGGWGGGSSGMYRWSNWTSTGSFNIDSVKQGTPYLPNYLAPSAGGSYGYKPFDSGTYGSDTYFAACVTYQGNGAINTKGGYVSDGHGANFNIRGNWAGERLNDFFWNNRDKTNDNVELGQFKSGESGWGYYYKTNGTDMKAIWIDSKKLYVPHAYTKEKDVIVKYENSDDPYDESNEFNHTSESAEWKYYNAPTEGEYRGKTPPDGEQSHDYSNTVNVTTQKVYKVVTITCLSKDAPKTFEEAEQIAESDIIDSKYTVKGKPTVTYKQDPVKELTQEITYKAETPDNSQTLFTPFNLNRNNYAEVGDGLTNTVTSDIVNAEFKLDGTVNNNQGIIDNTALNALDINNDTDFELKFNNKSIGMPSQFDWFTVPKDLNNGTWENVNSSYANGRNGDYFKVTDGGAVGYYRYNLALNASIGENANDLCSLTFQNGEEKVASEDLIFRTNNDPNTGFSGGTFAARFIMNGEYHTDNELNKTWNEWFVNNYTQDRFYEYGVEYKGKFDVNGIYEPELVANTTSPTATRDGYSFSTDGLNQRGLYVGKVSSNMIQPVLYGHWNVKTIAGDLK